MAVSLREVVEAGGYDITTPEDARWLLSRKEEIEELLEQAEEVVWEDEL